MITLNWSENISVNNEEIDNQHKVLFSLTNKLIDNIKAEANKQIIDESLAKLIDYTKFHFGKEEELMALNNYPNLDGHKDQHQYFLNRITDFSKDKTKQKPTIAKEIANFLINWIFKHVSGSDQQYKGYL